MPAESDAYLNLRLTRELKEIIEDAALSKGQAVGDFAISTLVQASRRILQDQRVTRLIARDRQLFIETLDDPSTRPNQELIKAVRQYRRQLHDQGLPPL
jgi:uncharacterized protein (DUF1778 family)